MRIISSAIFGVVNWASRNGLADTHSDQKNAAAPPSLEQRKLRAHRTGIRGETFAYWYLRHHGYVIVARNYISPGIKGEADLIGYDGDVLAFVEVKTRSNGGELSALPEHAVREDKRRNLIKLANRFLRDSRVSNLPCRFDVLAIETPPGRRPVVRLHKDAFASRPS